MAEKKPNPIDTHVGGRVRLRPVVPIYFAGQNSRLFQLAQVLEVPVQFFFDGAPTDEHSAGMVNSDADADAFIFEFLNSREGLELNRAFVKISDAKVRRSVVELVRSLGASESTSE